MGNAQFGNVFDDKVVLVTGAGQGIGRATAEAFARAGASVVVADAVGERARDVCRLLDELAPDGRRKNVAVEVDISADDEVQGLARCIEEEFGHLDCAFNNAGIIHPAAPLHEQELGDWERVFAVNARGTFLSMKHEIPLMLERGGAIVNGVSTLGLVGTADQCAYVASKHAIVGLTKAAALDYARLGIRVNAVAPGSVETPLAAATDPAKMAEYREAHPIGRIARPEEVATAVLFLAGDHSSNITGTVLSCDGGYTAR
jgi:NAD(P)-dependent dehydrogenase (short-subunit alcohol dehydrogenase family)